MEDLPLNLAHQEDRKAKRHLQYMRFDNAVECHLLAAKFLEDAMTNTCIPRALESLQLQKEYHVRQLQIISLKRAQLKALTSAIQSKLEIMANIKTKMSGGDQHGIEPRSLPEAIFRTMEEADSLFDLLVQRGDEVQNSPSQVRVSVDSSPISPCEGSKRPKEDHVVIEELHILNQQLRSFVEQLMEELSVYEKENKKLKLKIQELENEHKNCSKSNVSLQVITDSSCGNSSPFSQLSPEMTGKRELPALAPLEMPKFDYTLINKTEHPGQSN